MRPSEFEAAEELITQVQTDHSNQLRPRMTAAEPAQPTFALAEGGELPRRYFALRGFAMQNRVTRRALLGSRLGNAMLERLPALRAEYPDGRVFLVRAGDRTYERLLFFKEHEPETSAVVRRLLDLGDFALDIGANCGWFSLLMAARVGPGGEVWAFEPVPPILGALRANLAANPSLPITLHEDAVGAEPGSMEINLFAGLPHVHASASTLGRTDYVAHSANRVKIDDVLVRREGPPPTLVKVDVEGGELDVLRGAHDLLAGDRPPMWILEVNNQTAEAFGYRSAELVSHLRSYGVYDVFRIEGEGRLEPEIAPDLAPHGVNWLCVPAVHRDRLQR